MKNIAQSMTPKEAANAFYGQDEVAFAQMIEKLGKNDPRLARVFNNTRKRFLQDKDS
jgi:hypothetical protein